MIPIRLKLKNFLSHAESEIDFNDITMAVITGPNGNGKSSILDSITWSLFGKTDRAGSSADALVKRKTQDMRVEFTFALGQHNYRVSRGRSLSPDKSLLTFDMEVIGVWTPMAGGITETQALIEKTLHMDYQTLINSCVLLQGNSDEFSRRKPADRKDVLLRILGLDIYEQAAVAARKAHADLKALIDVKQSAITSLRERAEPLGICRGAKQMAVDAKTTTEQQMVIEQKHLEELQLHREIADKDLARFDEVEAQLAEAKNKDRQLATDIIRINDELAPLSRLLSKAPELRSAQAELKEINATLATLDAQFTEYQDLSIQAQAVELRIAELEGSRKSKIADANNACETRKSKLESRITVLEHTYQRRESEQLNTIAQIESQLITLESQASLINQVPCGDTPMAGECKLLASARTAKAKIDELRPQLAALKHGESADKSTLEETISLLECRKELQASDTWVESEAYTKAVADGATELPEYVSLRSLKERKTNLFYDSAKHATIRMQVAEFKDIPAQLEQLSKAEITIASQDAILNAKSEEIKSIHILIISFNTRLEGKHIVEDAVNAFAAKQIHQQQVIREVQGVLDLHVKTIAELDADIKQMEQFVAEAMAKEQEIADSTQRLEDLHMVSVGWGKNGVQAHLVEQAIPIIEDETNRLLGMLTDGLTVSIETQAATKKGSIAETLDIIIIGPEGRMEYGLYSGGEKFRVDFALRIALSKLLAHRAGARLETLIIDEGFGSQDPDGMTRLMDSLEVISSDFKCILVISHIDEMKEAFPVRIDVRKSTSGSQVTIIR